MIHGKRLIRDVSRVSNSSVFGAGIGAGLGVTVFTHFARSFGWSDLNLELLLGSLFTGELDDFTWWSGLFGHLLLSGGVAFVYAFIFRSARRSGSAIGLHLGFFHWALMGFLVALLPLLHPLIPSKLPATSLFMWNAGLSTTLVFLLSHLAYGAIFGSIFDRAAIRIVSPHGYRYSSL